MASLFEEMGGTYTLGADGMYYPNLELPEEETPRYGKYGRMRHTYLREYKKAYYKRDTSNIHNVADRLFSKNVARPEILRVFLVYIPAFFRQHIPAVILP